MAARSLYGLLKTLAGQAPDHAAVVDENGTYSASMLLEESERLARTFHAAGIRDGDRVGICLPNGCAFLAAIIATSRLGAVFVGINPVLRLHQVDHIVRHCATKLLVGSPRTLTAWRNPVGDANPVSTEVFQNVRVCNVDIQVSQAGSKPPWTAPDTFLPDDLATIVYTSGSTGQPKGVMHSNRSLIAAGRIVTAYLNNTPEDRVLGVLPLTFTYGLNQFVGMLFVGYTLVLQSSTLPGDIFRVLQQQGITGLPGTPQLWNLLLSRPKRQPRRTGQTLRYMTNSGGTPSKWQLQGLRSSFPWASIYLMYGSTETLRSTYLPPQELERGETCIGRPIPETDIWVLDSHGRECGVGKEGELVQAGPTVALGYWGNGDVAQDTFRFNEPSYLMRGSGDGVVRTGDLVRRDSDGYLYFVGRRDLIIKKQGIRLNPEQVEELVKDTPGVAEVGAFGQPDSTLGESVVAVVSVKHGSMVNENSVRMSCASRGPRFLTPDTVRVVEVELPKTANGKIDRKRLSELYSHSEAGSRTTQQLDDSRIAERELVKKPKHRE